MAKGAATWKRVKFGEVVRLVKETCRDPVASGVARVIGLEHLEPGDLRVRSWNDVADGTTFTTRVRPGQVLFGKRRAYQRKVAVADFDALCSGDIYVFESANPERLLPDFLPFVCQTEVFFEHAVGTSAGSLSPRTNWSSLAEYEFALPPLEEQRRLTAAARASTLVRESLRAAIDAGITLANSFCSHVVTAVASGAQLEVGAVAKFSSGKGIPVTSLPQAPSAAADVPVYGGNGIAGYTSKPLPDVVAPTVVIGRVGQFCGVTSLTSGPAWVTDNALYPVSIDNRIDMAFLALVLRGRRLNRGKLGEYLPLITQKVVHSTLIPVPSRAEQERSVEALREVEGSAARALARLAAADALHQRLLGTLNGTNGAAHGVH